MLRYEGAVAGVQASIVPPRLRLRGLKVIEKPGGDWKEPLLTVDEADVELAWRKLLHGALVADVVAERPAIRIVQRSRSSQSAQNAKVKAKRLPGLVESLQRQAPLKVDQLEFHRGEIIFVDQSRSPPPTLMVTGAEGTLDNITTRAALAQHRPTILDLKGIVQHSGELRVWVQADPWAKTMNFDGRASLVHLEATDVGSLLEATQKMKPVQGTVDLFVDVHARDGLLTGGVKPALHDVQMEAPRQSAFTKLKAWLANTALNLFSQHKGGQERFVTIIPIRGRITDPHAQLWPTVAGAIRNGFAQGITEGFSHLPPPTASHRQSPPKQIERALTKGPPEAQPSGRHVPSHRARP